MSTVVSNASPLIVLAKADLLQILPLLFTDVVVPQAVSEEIAAGPDDDPMRRILPTCAWLKTVKLDPPLSPLSGWQMGRGEAEVIEFGRLHGQITLLLDDRAGRRAAESLGLKVHGTLSVVAMAVKQRHIESFMTAVAKLRAAGL